MVRGLCKHEVAEQFGPAELAMSPCFLLDLDNGTELLRQISSYEPAQVASL